MKYFSLLSQASSKNLGHHIEAEVSGPYFDIIIPNLVRSLIGSVVRNFQFFHTEEGYAFYAKYITIVDAVNPQIASRLSKAFTVYGLIDSSSQKKMKKEIDLLLSHDTLSSGVREILEKVIS
jgi:aminopeptidase N